MPTASQQPLLRSLPPIRSIGREASLAPSHATSGLGVESRLMRLVARGDHDAFIAVYDSHAGAALAVARRITRNQESAEEVVQEAFVNLWRRAGSYRPERGSLRTFLLAIVRYRALDELRRQAAPSRRSMSDKGLEERHEAPGRTDVEATRLAEAASVRVALGRLPEDQSQPIALAFFAGLTHSEIAAELGMPIGTVKGRIRLGLQKLRTELPARVA